MEFEWEPYPCKYHANIQEIKKKVIKKYPCKFHANIQKNVLYICMVFAWRNLKAK